MSMFEQEFMIMDKNKKKYTSEEELVDFLATIYCECISGSEENREVLEEFIKENDLGDFPETSEEWVDFLNEFDEGWEVVL